MWAARVIDDAVAAHPVPTRAERREAARDQKRARRRDRDEDQPTDDRATVSAGR